MRLKGILLVVAVLASVALWAPDEAEALPMWARQTGLTCDACHYQHFPVLTAFGRNFKQGGFIDASQDLIESKDGAGLSLPPVLNAAFVTYSQYTQTSGVPSGTSAAKNTNDGQFQGMISSSVFFGGRVSEHIGFEGELAIQPLPAGLLNYKLPIIYDVGSAKVGAVVYSTGVYGPQFGMEVMNTGIANEHLFNQQDQAALSAQVYCNVVNPATGIDLVASNYMGYIVLGQWMPDETGASGTLDAYYVRVVATPQTLIPGFDFGIGAAWWTGHGGAVGNVPGVVGGAGGPSGPTNGSQFFQNPTGVNPVQQGMFAIDAYSVDAQLLGEVGSLPLTVIASYAAAPSDGVPSGTAGGFQGNIYNPGPETRSSFNIGAELGVIPKRLTLQVALRQAKSGFTIGSVSNATDNALLVGMTYSLAMNVHLDLTYSQYSGDMYSTAAQAALGGAYNGNTRTTITLAAGF